MTVCGGGNPMTDAIRVFLVDDHELMRRALRDVLDAEVDLDVVGEAGSVEEATQRIPDHQPAAAEQRAEQLPGPTSVGEWPIECRRPGGWCSQRSTIRRRFGPPSRPAYRDIS